MMARRAGTTAVSDLKTFFAGAALSNGAIGYHEFRGFLFAVVAVPEMIPPSEWLPVGPCGSGRKHKKCCGR